MSPPHLYFFKIIWATLSPLSKDSDKLGYSFALRSFLVPSKAGWQLSQCFWFPEPPSEEWAVWGPVCAGPQPCSSPYVSITPAERATE